jgi:hypothetical protein
MSVGNRGGRPRKPTAIKRLQGTLYAYRENKQEPQFGELKIDDAGRITGEAMPGWLVGDLEAYRRAAKAFGVIVE